MAVSWLSVISSCKYVQRRQKIFKGSVEKLTHFVVENLNYLFYFFDFNVPFPLKIGGTKDFIGKM